MKHPRILTSFSLESASHFGLLFAAVILAVATLGVLLLGLGGHQPTIAQAATATSRQSSSRQPLATAYVYSSRGKYSHVYIHALPVNLKGRPDTAKTRGICNGKPVPQVHSGDELPLSLALPNKAASGEYPPLKLECTSSAVAKISGPNDPYANYNFRIMYGTRKSEGRSLDYADGAYIAFNQANCTYLHSSRNDRGLAIFELYRSSGSCEPGSAINTGIEAFNDTVDRDSAKLTVKNVKLTRTSLSIQATVKTATKSINGAFISPLTKPACGGIITVEYYPKGSGVNQGFDSVFASPQWNKSKGCTLIKNFKLDQSLKRGEYTLRIKSDGNQYLKDTTHADITRKVK